MGQLYDQFLSRQDLDIHKWHHYFPIYETYLAKFRGEAPRVLEIGVKDGGSSRLFSNWFGQGTRIIGVDIDPKCVANAVLGRIDIVIGDQADRAFLAQLAAQHGPWDVVLDDGGHTDNQILTSFEVLFPHVKNGGVYLIEDTHAHWLGPSFQDHPEGRDVVQLVGMLFGEMHGWTGDKSRFGHWHVPPPERTAPTPASFLTQYVAGVHLFDSVVVIEKKRRDEPFAEVRKPRQPRRTAYRLPES